MAAVCYLRLLMLAWQAQPQGSLLALSACLQGGIAKPIPRGFARYFSSRVGQGAGLSARHGKL